MTTWKPMKSAPEDGTHVLIYMENGEQCVGKYYGERGVRSWGLAHVGDGAIDHQFPSKPECWRYLPPPPKSDGHGRTAS